MYINSVRFRNYYVQVKFSGDNDLSLDFEEVQMQARTVRPGYTRFLLGLRYTFFILSLVVNLVYIYRYFELPANMRLPEQKYVLGLALSLVFFNDPFFALYIYFPNEASSVFSVLTLSVFVSYLFYFWVYLLSYIGENMEVRPVGVKLLGFVLLVGSTFGSLLAFHLQSLKHPIFSDLLTKPAQVLLIIAVILYVAHTLYIFYRLVRLCEAEHLLWRNNLFMMLGFIYVPVTVLALANFSLSVYALGKEVVVVVINYNLLVWVYMYLYSPTGQFQDPAELAHLDYEERLTDQNYLDLADLDEREVEVTLSPQLPPSQPRGQGSRQHEPLDEKEMPEWMA